MESSLLRLQEALGKIDRISDRLPVSPALERLQEIANISNDLLIALQQIQPPSAITEIQRYNAANQIQMPGVMAELQQQGGLYFSCAQWERVSGVLTSAREYARQNQVELEEIPGPKPDSHKRVFLTLDWVESILGITTAVIELIGSLNGGAPAKQPEAPPPPPPPAIVQEAGRRVEGGGALGDEVSQKELDLLEDIYDVLLIICEQGEVLDNPVNSGGDAPVERDDLVNGGTELIEPRT